VFICKLRKKLANALNGENYIETVWGRGYALREPSAVERTIRAREPVGVRTKAEPQRAELFQP
jgi:two-component system, cell cycle response regulator CtrA